MTTIQFHHHFHTSNQARWICIE